MELPKVLDSCLLGLVFLLLVASSSNFADCDKTGSKANISIQTHTDWRVIWKKSQFYIDLNWKNHIEKKMSSPSFSEIFFMWQAFLSVRFFPFFVLILFFLPRVLTSPKIWWTILPLLLCVCVCLCVLSYMFSLHWSFLNCCVSCGMFSALLCSALLCPVCQLTLFCLLCLCFSSLTGDNAPGWLTAYFNKTSYCYSDFRAISSCH